MELQLPCCHIQVAEEKQKGCGLTAQSRYGKQREILHEKYVVNSVHIYVKNKKPGRRRLINDENTKFTPHYRLVTSNLRLRIIIVPRCACVGAPIGIARRRNGYKITSTLRGLKNQHHKQK